MGCDAVVADGGANLTCMCDWQWFGTAKQLELQRHSSALFSAWFVGNGRADLFEPIYSADWPHSGLFGE